MLDAYKALVALRWFFVAVLLGLSAPAVATPSAAFHSRDILLGANEGSYFVMRYETDYPGNYYRRTLRVLLVKLSNWSGKRQEDCLLRGHDWVAENADPDNWKRSFVAGNCPEDGLSGMADMNLAYAHSGYVIPPRLTEDVLSDEYVLSRFVAATQSAGDQGALGLQEDCGFRGEALSVMEQPWIYLAYRCGAGDQDVDTQEVLIPVSRRTWIGSYE